VLDALNTLFNDRALYAGRLAESAKWRVAIDEASLQPTAISSGPSMGGGMGSSAGMQTGGATTAAPSSGSSNSSMNTMR
jgi:hypothetical protein